MSDKRYAITEASGDFPPLMLIYHNLLSPAQCQRIREIMKQAQESGGPFVIEGGFEVFQLVGGKWLHVDGSVELEDAPMPEKINFREFT